MGDRRPRAPGPAGIRTLWGCAAGAAPARDSRPLPDARRRVPAHRRLPAFGATHASLNQAERRPAAHRASLR